MSGLNEIKQWIEEEIDLSQDEDGQAAYDSISTIFLKDNRSSLDEILGLDKNTLLDWLDTQIESNKEIEDFGQLQFSPIIKAIGGFIKRLFR